MKAASALWRIRLVVAKEEIAVAAGPLIGQRAFWAVPLAALLTDVVAVNAAVVAVEPLRGGEPSMVAVELGRCPPTRKP